MLKYLINLLAAVTSFFALLFVANSSVTANSTGDRPTDNIVPSQLEVSLNIISPELKTATKQHISFSHFGCACAVCTQAIEQASFKL